MKINPRSCCRLNRDYTTSNAGVIKNALDAINPKKEDSILLLVLINTFLVKEYTRIAAKST